MSAIKEERQKKKSRSRRRRAKTTQEVSWKNVDAAAIRGAIDIAERLDGAVRFGRSRDRSVYSLGFYIGDDRFTEWVRPSDEQDYEFARILDEIAEDYGMPSIFDE